MYKYIDMLAITAKKTKSVRKRTGSARNRTMGHQIEKRIRMV